MKVKRRTVWLLTLFSLVAVISVYYIFEPNEKLNLATIFTDDTLEQTTLTGVESKGNINTESHLFEDMRMEIANERSQLKDQLTQKIGNEKTTAEEKNEAYDKMNELIKQESSEAMLEMLIKSLGYSDALVRVEEDKVAVTVLTNEEISKKQANEIIYIVKSELENAGNVVVNTQSNYY